MIRNGIYESPSADEGWKYLRVVGFDDDLVWAQFLVPKIHWRSDIKGQLKRPYFEKNYTLVEHIPDTENG